MPSTRVCFAVLLIVCVSVAPVAGQSDDYEITLGEEVDIPERTLDTDSGEFTVSVAGRYAEGDTVDVSTSGPGGTSYAVRLFDSQEYLRASRYPEEDGNVQFSLSRYDPGTYAIVITPESNADEILAIKPLVIYGYTVSHTTPNETAVDSTLTIEFSLDRVSGEVEEPPASVEVTLGNDSTSLTTEATRTSDLNYTAKIDVDPLSPGDYRLYTGIQRDNTVYGYQELIGVNTYQVSVVESTATETPTETPTATQTQTPSTTTSGSGATQEPGAPAAGTQTTASATTATMSPATTTRITSPNSTQAVTSTTSPITTAESNVDEDPTRAPTASSQPTTSASPGSEAGSSTPVNTPVLPDGGMFVLGIVAVALLSRLR
ncbi:RodZ family helix-turn-helix domain-containing protein [Halobellus clavatus]|uniref:Uncharacterized protein n=1 Tax=Halobellus clavatus TaxID=660517 RepID=A0A1H3FND9_9EURY|nr:hypothetical protein [Halobellus clavatus]SDX92603.1 hypothetical protein SAMN04487946_10482 [Halobellus clavatus]